MLATGLSDQVWAVAPVQPLSQSLARRRLTHPSAIWIGKLYHPGLPPNEDNAHSWSEPLVDVGGNEGCNCSTTPGGDSGKMSCELPDDVGDGCADLVNWNAARVHLQRAKTLEQPFFIGFGIHKPHLPWAVPERFFRQYTRDALPVAEHKDIPTGMPPIAWHRGQWGHFNHSFDPISGPVSDEIAREARHGYFAAVSFADDLVGKALDALEETGKANNTVVLLTADHGWQLGEVRLSPCLPVCHWGRSAALTLPTRYFATAKPAVPPSTTNGASRLCLT